MNTSVKILRPALIAAGIAFFFVFSTATKPHYGYYGPHYLMGSISSGILFSVLVFTFVSVFQALRRLISKGGTASEAPKPKLRFFRIGANRDDLKKEINIYSWAIMIFLFFELLFHASLGVLFSVSSLSTTLFVVFSLALTVVVLRTYDLYAVIFLLTFLILNAIGVAYNRFYNIEGGQGLFGALLVAALALRLFVSIRCLRHDINKSSLEKSA